MQTTTFLNEKHTTQYIGAPLTTTASEKPPVSVETAPETPPTLAPDTREGLYNEGSIGPNVQLPTEQITRLRGILFDIDPANLREGPLMPALCQDPQEFYENCLQRWLSNHPLLQHLEVRVSGTGLHAILWLDSPVEFAEDAEQTKKRWCSIVKVVQAVLPTDPMAPGITATTRAVGSVNTKDGHKTVRLLKGGRPVAPEDVIALANEMSSAPFATLFRVLTGSDRIAPCPICNCESLVALKHIGKCVNCGKINFERLCNLLFHGRKIAEDRHG